ncbi:MAG: hypothetical protein QOD69_2159 [Solirubrobacteraceae bacterium]|nr:hypothetical protein [Solirubrobacteraceae bacterium]
MARRLIEIARELGDRLQWPSPNTGAAVPAC